MTPQDAKVALEAKGYQVEITQSHVCWRENPTMVWGEEVITLPDDGDPYVDAASIEAVPTCSN